MEGKKRVKQEKKIYVGITNSRVKAICPSNEELAELLGFEVDESKDEIEYTKEKDGVNTVRLDFWMEEIKSGYRYKKSFFLEDKDVVTKPKEGQDNFVAKYQYVNQTGDAFYIDDENNLPDYFTKFQKNKSKTDKTKVVYGEKSHRVAKVGEADLMDFVKKWLNELDYWDADTSILLDVKKLFRGNFDELQEQVGGSLVTDDSGKEVGVVDILGAKPDKDDSEKYYQDVYKTCLPGYLYKTMKSTKWTPEHVEKLRTEKKDKVSNPDGRYLKDYEQLIVDITDPVYPWKSEFELVDFKEFDPSTVWVSSGNVLEHSDDGNDY